MKADGTKAGPMNLGDYDWIVVNSSAGKDSQAMRDHLVGLAREAGVLDRLVVVHCDLGRVEWTGTRELAERQAKHYGARFEVVSRRQGDLLQHVRDRGMWPGGTTRYCTSDHKRGQVYRLLTALTREKKHLGRQVRILNCLGLRAQESPARSKKVAFQFDKKASNGRRHVDTWLPILSWLETEVWDVIRKSGVEHHRAYDVGMPRLSCCFCIFAPKNALMLAGRHNRELLDEYVTVEKEIEHRFRQDVSLVEIADALERGEEIGAIRTWSCS